MWLEIHILLKHQLSVLYERPNWLDREVYLLAQTALSFKEKKNSLLNLRNPPFSKNIFWYKISSGIIFHQK